MKKTFIVNNLDLIRLLAAIQVALILSLYHYVKKILETLFSYITL